MDTIIDTVATGLGTSIGWLASSGILFLAFAALWVAFGVALVGSQGSLDQAWATIRDLPLVVQALAWLLFLPVMAGMWVWETAWPLVARLVVIVGLAGWNLLVLLPRATPAGRP
jgi:hypothetical protein